MHSNEARVQQAQTLIENSEKHGRRRWLLRKGQANLKRRQVSGPSCGMLRLTGEVLWVARLLP